MNWDGFISGAKMDNVLKKTLRSTSTTSIAQPSPPPPAGKHVGIGFVVKQVRGRWGGSHCAQFTGKLRLFCSFHREDWVYSNICVSPWTKNQLPSCKAFVHLGAFNSANNFRSCYCTVKGYAEIYQIVLFESSSCFLDILVCSSEIQECI